MIIITDKRKCCGCSACVQKCPKQCIIMSEDEEGFIYPRVNLNVCIDCHLCEKVCPVFNQNEIRIPIQCYAAVNTDADIRKESSSGGIFTMLAEKVLDQGGVVFGAAWNEKWQVVHKYTDNKGGLSAFRGSKYVQSIIGNSYKQAEEFLKDGRFVLFTGTPCQIAGLKKFLGKDYENLLAVDFICHGVPSPKVFRWYLQEEIDQFAAQKRYDKPNKCSSVPHIPKEDIILPDGVQIRKISFRDKRKGWKTFSLALSVFEEIDCRNNRLETISSTLHENSFLKGFLNDYYLRPICEKCPAKQFKSGADLTIADYWGYQGNIIEDDDTGISAVLLLTVKGEQAFESIGCLSCEVPYNDILRINAAAEQSVSAPYRAYFFKQKNMSFNQVITKLTSRRFVDKLVRKFWLITHRE